MHISRDRTSISEILEDLSILRKEVIFSTDFMRLNRDDQQKIYDYCKFNAQVKICKDNLAQIRYAVTRLYFKEDSYYM